MFRYSSISFKLYWEHQYRLSKKCLEKGTVCISRSISSNHKEGNKSQNKWNKKMFIGLTIAGVSALFISRIYKKKTIDGSNKLGLNESSNKKNNLPTYTLEEVNKHYCHKSRIWIAYKEGVYDITNFVKKHPGGENLIMMGAGTAIDPFWRIFANHNKDDVLKLLETMRIGNLHSKDVYQFTDTYDPYALEPNRSKKLKVNGKQPFCAEPPSPLLVQNFKTPSDIFYIRNHLPVPLINIEDYEIELALEETTVKTLTLDDIKKFPKYTVTSAIMCGGNRRSEMAEAKALRGLSWNVGAVGNANWSGARLCDVLEQLGIKEEDYNHLQFEGMDVDPSGNPYGASIPVSKAFDPRADVLLAYEMNEEAIPLDHGYPVRVIVPGVVGARNVKWLSKMILSKDESPSQFQQRDYKGFSPSVDWDTVDFSKAPAIQEMPVTSAICVPQKNEQIQLNKDGTITVQGYAWSGGGKKIIRVDVTADKGKTWHIANLVAQDPNAKDGRHYAWTLWSLDIPVTKSAEPIEIWSKAVDSAYNVQPESFNNIWNLRGFLCNAYHKVKVEVL